MQPETQRELKALTIDEIQRSPLVPNHQREDLVYVLTIFWAAGPRLFVCDKLAKLLEERPSADRLRFDLITAIVPEANPQLIFSVFLDFLSQQGETQDSLLESRALVTNLITGELENFRDANFIRKRANHLAQCFTENRSSIIEALVNAIRIWIAGQHTTEIPAPASPSGSVSDSFPRVIVLPVSVPMATAENKTVSEKKKPRSETSLEQFKARTKWLEGYLETKDITKSRLVQASELRGTPINHRTIQKILDGKPVQENTLVKLARVTGVKRSEIP